MNLTRPLLLVFLLTALTRAANPNIIIILADDIGYGDLSCYGATAVQTPAVDKLAAQGLRFTDAHAAASTCTPTRYSLLTGQYAWRKKGTNILPGDANLIIEPGINTLPSMLQKAGYTTAAVGKWHLGLGAGAPPDWNKPITPGPREIGFNYSFILPATGDRVPCVYMENQKVVGLDSSDPISVQYGKKIGDEPTGKENPDQLKMHPSHGHDMTIVNGISRIGFMSGGKTARWVDEDMADTLTAKATTFIEQNKDKPFFLYFATHDIHVPRVPHPRFQNKTNLGPRGDALVQFDWSVSQIVATLDRLKIADNTLIIITSDNGAVIDDGYKDDAVTKLGAHKPSGPLRGGKYSPFEGGTRIPFILRWPAKVKPATSAALVCQIDLLASFAQLTAQPLAKEDAPDSIATLAAFTGDSPKGRDHLVEQAGTLTLRQDQWKYIPKGGQAREGGAAEQLYNLADDLAETKNLAAQNPGKIQEMSALLEKIKQAGRSRD